MLNKLPTSHFNCVFQQCCISNPYTNEKNAWAWQRQQCHYATIYLLKIIPFVRLGLGGWLRCQNTQWSFFFFLLIKRIRHSLENCCIEELFLAIALNVPPLFIFTALEISSAGNSTLSSRRHLAGVRSEIWLVDSCWKVVIMPFLSNSRVHVRKCQVSPQTAGKRKPQKVLFITLQLLILYRKHNFVWTCGSEY